MHKARELFAKLRLLGWEAPAMRGPNPNVYIAMMECIARSPSWHSAPNYTHVESESVWAMRNVAGINLRRAQELFAEMQKQRDFTWLSRVNAHEDWQRRLQRRRRNILARAHNALIRCCKNAAQAHERERLRAEWAIQVLNPHSVFPDAAPARSRSSSSSTSSSRSDEIARLNDIVVEATRCRDEA